MGQRATLYRISKIKFGQLSQDGFHPNMADTRVTFDQNFEGLIFLLSKFGSNAERSLVQEIFYPKESLGEKPVPPELNFLDDLSFLETETVNYLNLEKVKAIRDFLDRIDKNQLLRKYDPKELNEQGVYPGVWHNNESSDQAFNRRHVEEGFDNLVKLFDEAAREGNLILVFVG